MTSADTSLPLWLDSGLRQTNPVCAARCLIASLEQQYIADFWNETCFAQEQVADWVRARAAQGIRLPAFALEDFIRQGAIAVDFPPNSPEQRHGVLGLLAHPDQPLAFVLPLRAQRGSWRVESSLPFAKRDIQDNLLRMLHAARVPTSGLVPERFGFAFSNPLGQQAQGDSMTVAALLAVLDELGERRSSALHAACALVEPLPNGDLKPVGRISDKLTAALREAGQLSLVIGHPDSHEIHSFPSACLGRVRWVRSMTDLANCLNESGIDALAPLLRQAPLQRGEAHRVRDDLHELNRTHHFREAADLGDRLQHCAHAAPIEPGVWTEIARLRAEACRHQGRSRDAMTFGRKIWSEVKALGPLTSDDEEAAAAAEYAASLFDNHQFHDMAAVLDEWAVAAAATPRRFRPLTRVMVWNTLGRGLAMLGSAKWEELFRRSLRLHQELNDAANVDRTRSYLVHALVRHQDVRGAQAELSVAGFQSESLPPDPWLAFTAANVARCVGKCWEHVELDRLLDEAPGETDSQRHAYALYFQATARQEQRDRADAIRRFKCAAAFMRAEAGGSDTNICALFAHMLDVAAAHGADPVAWRCAFERIRDFLDLPLAAPLRDYYLPFIEQLSDARDPQGIELLLRRVPYF